MYFSERILCVITKDEKKSIHFEYSLRDFTSSIAPCNSVTRHIVITNIRVLFQMSYKSEVRTTIELWATLGATFVFTLYFLYRLALPRPFPDIPHNAAAARSLLGDLPAISSYLKKGHNTLIMYFNDTVISLNAPLVQVFLKPLGAPTLLLSDFNEARRMLMETTNFDRSPALKNLVIGLVPDHHIHLKTDAAWRAQRQQIQDLMKPSFLKDIAGPIIYQNTVDLMDAWVVKCRIANGRPWSAAADVRNAVLDVMIGLAFGPQRKHNATRSMLEGLNARQDKEEDNANEQAQNRDKPIDFFPEQLSDVLQAMRDLTETVMDIHGSPMPYLKWAYVNRKPRVRRATRCKEQYIAQQIQDAVTRMKQAPPEDASWVKSATDQVVLAECRLADRDGRAPKYFSRIIFDEVSTRQRQCSFSCGLILDSFLESSSQAEEPLQQPYAGLSNY